MELDGVWEEKIEKWRRELQQTKKILIPVISNQILTLAGWCYVYDCQTDPNSLAYYLLDSRHSFTTGSDIYDGALNGVICVSLLAAMSFFMLMVAIYNFQKLIKAKDALNDGNSIRLGLGDFIFYSVLVGKAASSGSLLATYAAMNGVVMGLMITLTVFSDSDETMPALPCSVALGMLFHQFFH